MSLTLSESSEAANAAGASAETCGGTKAACCIGHRKSVFKGLMAKVLVHRTKVDA